jgi:hypothetical protein
MLEMLRQDLEGRRGGAVERTLALAKIPGRRYATGRTERG